MDLIGVLPSDGTNHSVSVYRLIDDKQTGSALLFNEKVPFRPTAIGWVPDKRGLAVGDASGNVFVFDAERQRTIELQKVHDCGIRSIDWTDLGSRRSRLVKTSATGKLPRIFACPGSIQQLFGECHTDDSVELVNEALASSDRRTILSVLSNRGNVQLYYGGSIPIGEFSVSSLFGSGTDLNYLSGILSPDAATLAILAERKHDSEEVSLFLVNTGLIRFRFDEISALAQNESDIDWLLRQFNQAVTAIDRAVTPSLEELDSGLGHVLEELDEEMIAAIAKGDVNQGEPKFLKDLITREFSAPNKLAKLSKTTLSALDFLLSTLLSRVCVIADHLTMRCVELGELYTSGSYTVLGLSSGNTAGLVERLIKELRPRLNSLVNRVRDTSLVMKYILGYLETFLEESPRPISTPSRVVEILRQNPKVVAKLGSLVPSSGLLEEGKAVELLYVQLLSNQRRTISSRLVGKNFFRFSRNKSSQTPQIRWVSEHNIELVYEEDCGKVLVVVQINVMRRDQVVSRLEFKAPEGSSWMQPKFYTEDQICVVLVHQQVGSICLLRYSEWIQETASRQIEPDEYGFPIYFVAQQIPTKGARISAMEVSGPRGLCSIYCEGGRMITLDLENADEDEENEEEEDSSPSPDKLQKRRRQLNKIDSLLDPGGENRYGSNTTPLSDDDEHGGDDGVAQRLRFAP